MSREEEAIRATTRAVAATVRDVPPLELEPAPDELWSPGRWPRRARRGGSGRRLPPWLAPVAAAAVIVVMAVSLVMLRSNPNESVVPQPAATSSGPGGVPRYYVALNSEAGKTASNGLLVGDTVTGETLPVMPPPHMSFGSVTAAADDRTFFAFATEAGGSRTSGLWFILVLAPGTDHVITLSSTAIAQQSGVIASALSASGKYLAVAETGPAQGQRRVIVFSVATGRPLRTWSTREEPALWAGYSIQENLLTWIEGDRAIAFSDYDDVTGATSVRRLNVGGPLGEGDLIAGSQLIWSATASSVPLCGFIPPLVSADGRTIACVTTGGKDFQLTFTWRAYQASTRAPAAGTYAIAYQLTRQVSGGTAFTADTLWVSPSGSALIGEWVIDPYLWATTSPSSSGNGSSSASAKLQLGGVPAGVVNVGVMSHGTFTPLRLPQRVLSLPAYAIAW